MCAYTVKRITVSDITLIDDDDDFSRIMFELYNKGSIPEVRGRVGVLYLAQVGVEVDHTVAKFLHILCEQLVCVGYAVIQIPHFVVGETSEGARRDLTNTSRIYIRVC